MHLVKVYRLERGLSLKDLGERSGLTTKIIYLIENKPDYNAKKKTMQSIARALDLPVSVLFFPEEEIRKRAMISGMFVHTIDVLDERGFINKRRFFGPVSFSTETKQECEV